MPNTLTTAAAALGSSLLRSPGSPASHFLTPPVTPRMSPARKDSRGPDDSSPLTEASVNHGRRGSFQRAGSALVQLQRSSRRRAGSSIRKAPNTDEVDRPGDQLQVHRKRQHAMILDGRKCFDHMKVEEDTSYPYDLHLCEEALLGRRGQSDHTERVSIRFTQELEVGRNERSRAVVVTERFVHVLQQPDAAGERPSLVCGRYSREPCASFLLSDLATIIESQKAPEAVCLDIRPKDKKSAKQAVGGKAGSSPERVTILQSGIDQTLLLFPFPKVPGTEAAEEDQFGAAFGFKAQFLAHLRALVPGSAKEPDALRAPVMQLNFGLRTADDVQRAISRAVRKSYADDDVRMVDLIDTTRDDMLKLAQMSDVVRALRRQHVQKLFFSHEVNALKRSGAVKARRLLVVTDSALFYLDRDYVTVRRVELQNLNSIVYEDRLAGQTNCTLVLVKVDLVNDKSKRYPTDLLFTIRRRDRDALITAISTAYEDLMIDRLPVHAGENISRSKRGRVEAMIKQRFGSEQSKQVYDRSSEAIGWLAYVLRYKRRDLLMTLSQGVLPQEDMHFMARSLVDLCEAEGTTGELVRDAVHVEMDVAEQRSAIFRGSSLSTAILNEYNASGKDHVKIVLSQVMEQFLSHPHADPARIEELHRRLAADPSNRRLQREFERDAQLLCSRCDEFFDRITATDMHLPPEVNQTVKLINDIAQQRGIPPKPLIGGYILLRLFVPAIGDPANHGLLASHRIEKLTQEKKLALLFISRVLQMTSNGSCFKESGEPGAAKAINWWIQRRHKRERDESSQMPHHPLPGWVEAAYGSWYRSGTTLVVPSTWDEYIAHVLRCDHLPSSQNVLTGLAAPTPDEPEIDIAAVEARVAEDGFILPFDAKVLASVHKTLSAYTEKMLCMLWTDVAVTQVKLHKLEERRQRLAANSDCHLSLADSEDSPQPQQRRPSDQSAGSDGGGSPRLAGFSFPSPPRSQMMMDGPGSPTRHRRASTFFRRASLAAVNARAAAATAREAKAERKRKGRSAKHGGVAPPASADARASSAQPSALVSAADTDRDMTEYAANLRRLLADKSAELQALGQIEEELSCALAAQTLQLEDPEGWDEL